MEILNYYVLIGVEMSLVNIFFTTQFTIVIRSLFSTFDYNHKFKIK